VIKGGASYLFGEDALSGAVIITTKRGAKYAGATVAAEAGSFDYYKRLARVGFAGEKGSAHIQYTERGSDDYYDLGQFGSTYLSGNGQLYLTDTSDLTFGFEKSDRNKDSHGTVKGKTMAEIDPRSILGGRDYSRKYDVELEKLNLTYSNNYSHTGNLLAMIYQYKDHTKYWSSPHRTNISNDAYVRDNDQDQVQRGFKGEWRDSIKSVGLLGGIDIRANNYKNKVNCKMVENPSCPAVGTVYSKDDTDEDMKALYGEVKFDPAKDWTLTFNGRHDNVALDYKNVLTAATGSRSFSANSWRAGANYDISPTMGFYGNISTGFRTPTQDQLFVTSTSPTVKTNPNPNLKPERAVNKEIGWRAKTSWLGVEMDLDAALFQIDRKDFIMSTNGQYASGPAGADEQSWDNIGGVRNRGLELSLRSDPKREFSVNVAYTYINAKFTDYDKFNLTLGNPTKTLVACSAFINPATQYCQTAYNLSGYRVPRVSENQLNTTFNWQPNSAFRLSLEADAKSWSYADEINQEKLPGRTLFNLLAHYDVKEKGFMGAKWSVFGRIDNIFDRYYWVTARGTNDTQNAITNLYSGTYNADDLSIVVGRGRVWTTGLSATF
jgi:iron complex outermembrane receptor protein